MRSGVSLQVTQVAVWVVVRQKQQRSDEAPDEEVRASRLMGGALLRNLFPMRPWPSAKTWLVHARGSIWIGVRFTISVSTLLCSNVAM